MPHHTDDHIGARIADYRKLRHLTQNGLAQRAFVSRGTIAKVEAGLSPATPAIVAAVARVLEIDVAVLNGQPYVSEMQQDELDRLIAPLSEALTYTTSGRNWASTPGPYPTFQQTWKSCVSVPAQRNTRALGPSCPDCWGS
ncbi:transcriptional regulator [Streptomyces sp. NBRC 110611]|uniref:helix-turn-helix domain-containing protein n=1 Tax=Streptomyces sp. NBRC 110611 TaxID=1621259 RepID=UPI000858ADFC|nr:helix-turn-helix transcriptional regulator [Streptomyces sp. NBRC 110611]GAU66525.1 transcriptional regulator [Streptomyces sp. NBRC 110611]